MSIQFYRKKKNMTQTELANATGVTQAYICTLENGKRQNPSVQLLLKIAKVLDAPVAELISDQKEAV